MPDNEPDDLARAKERRGSVSPLRKRAARERSRALRRERAERLFAERFWPVERAVAWIAYRDPALIEKNWRHSQFYDHPASKPPPLRDKTPRATLLRALQNDELRAIKDGKEMSPEDWAGFDGRNWPAVYFRREDVLVLWRVRGRPQHLREMAKEALLELLRKNGKLPGQPKERDKAVNALLHDQGKLGRDREMTRDTIARAMREIPPQK